MQNTATIDLKMPERHKKILDHVLNKFIGNPHIDSIYLFGSCANGTATEKSDIDVFVVTNTNVVDDSHEVFKLLYGCTNDIPLDDYVDCDIITASKEEFQQNFFHLVNVVKRKGIKLYGVL